MRSALRRTFQTNDAAAKEVGLRTCAVSLCSTCSNVSLVVSVSVPMPLSSPFPQLWPLSCDPGTGNWGAVGPLVEILKVFLLKMSLFPLDSWRKYSLFIKFLNSSYFLSVLFFGGGNKLCPFIKKFAISGNANSSFFAFHKCLALLLLILYNNHVKENDLKFTVTFAYLWILIPFMNYFERKFLIR